MKKNRPALILAALMLTLTIPVSAAPITWSGETKYKYQVEKEGDDSEKSHEVKLELNLKSQVDDNTTAYATVELKNKLKDSDNKEKSEINLKNVYFKHKFSESVGIKAGAQPLEIGKGMWMDKDGFTGANIELEQNSFETNLYYGRDNGDDDGEVETIRLIEWKKEFDQGEASLYTGKQENKNFTGIYGEVQVSPRTALSAEWVKNRTDHKTGYVVEAVFGKAKKPGQFEYGVSYRKMEQDLFTSNDFTGYDDNYDEDEGFKGFAVEVVYRLSKACKLELSHDWGETLTDKKDMATTKLSMKAKF